MVLDGYRTKEKFYSAFASVLHSGFELLYEYIGDICVNKTNQLDVKN